MGTELRQLNLSPRLSDESYKKQILVTDYERCLCLFDFCFYIKALMDLSNLCFLYGKDICNIVSNVYFNGALTKVRLLEEVHPKRDKLREDGEMSNWSELRLSEKTFNLQLFHKVVS